MKLQNIANQNVKKSHFFSAGIALYCTVSDGDNQTKAALISDISGKPPPPPLLFLVLLKTYLQIQSRTKLTLNTKITPFDYVDQIVVATLALLTSGALLVRVQ